MRFCQHFETKLNYAESCHIANKSKVMVEYNYEKTS